jgi:nicotinate-nucleotide adenylyltransferase
MAPGPHIALFGGSFNPPHLAHVFDVAWALSCGASRAGRPVDAVWVAPTFSHAFGKGLASFEHRLEMVRRAMEPFAGRVVVSTIERDLGGESRTIRVVDAMLEEDPTRQISLVVGADILQEIDRWLESERLLRTVELVVLGRRGYEEEGSVPGLEMPEMSSTQIRSWLSAGAYSRCAPFVPSAVLEYIRCHGLYQDGSG